MGKLIPPETAEVVACPKIAQKTELSGFSKKSSREPSQKEKDDDGGPLKKLGTLTPEKTHIKPETKRK